MVDGLSCRRIAVIDIDEVRGAAGVYLRHIDPDHGILAGIVYLLRLKI